MVCDFFHQSKVSSLIVSHTSHFAQLGDKVDDFKFNHISYGVTNFSVVNQKWLFVISNDLIILLLVVLDERYL